MIKFLGLFLVALVTLVVGFCWVVSANIDDMIKTEIEQKMTALTKTKVTLSNVDVDFLSGRIAITNFVIGNPKGYISDNLIRLGDVQVKIDIRSLDSNAIIIESIQLNEVNVVIEEKSIGELNIKSLIDTVESADPMPEPVDLLRFRLKAYSVGESTLKLVGGPLAGKTLFLPAMERQSDLGHPISLPLKNVVKTLVQEIMKGVLKEGKGVVKQSITQGLAHKTKKIRPPVNVRIKLQRIKKVIEKELPPITLPPLPFLKREM